jgi:hypothetical protein
MKEKKELSAEEIEAQVLIELPDRSLMQSTGQNFAANGSLIDLVFQAITIALGL